MVSVQEMAHRKPGKVGIWYLPNNAAIRTPVNDSWTFLSDEDAPVTAGYIHIDPDGIGCIQNSLKALVPGPKPKGASARLGSGCIGAAGGSPQRIRYDRREIQAMWHANDAPFATASEPLGLVA